MRGHAWACVGMRGHAWAHIRATEGVDVACLLELRAEALGAVALAPPQHARQVVARAERQHAHRRPVAERRVVDRLQHPRDRAVAAYMVKREGVNHYEEGGYTTMRGDAFAYMVKHSEVGDFGEAWLQDRGLPVGSEKMGLSS